jgi:endonuclease YncB( thermonuclease family)
MSRLARTPDADRMRRPLPITLGALASLALLWCSPASTGGPPVRVVSIGDGDTIRVEQGSQRLTIRLACIDTPEMAQRPHGPMARQVPAGAASDRPTGDAESADH